MKLAQLLSIFPQLRWGEAAHLEVKTITQDSREVQAGVVFIAIRGSSLDGHDYVKSVCRQGATAVVVEDDSQVPQDFKGAVVKVKNSRLALDQLAQRFYNYPSKSLFCVGITGTNGKTTTAYMVEAVLNHFSWPTGVLGTIDHHLRNEVWASSLTTPDPLTLQKRLQQFVEKGAEAAVFEVSSHALAQSRVDSVPFAVGVFTNLTRDHLDYHQTMQDYFLAKERLFSELLGQGVGTSVAILNGDDQTVRTTRIKEGVTVWWYGSKDADFTFRLLQEDLSGSLFHLTTPRGNVEVRLACPGLHNVYNATAAIAVGLAAGMSLERAVEALAEFRGAPGRLEKVENARGLHIFIDYAHTDDALRSVLTALHRVRTKGNGRGRILTVFGCGGDRDRGKRPLMAKAASERSDILILTSDNPRTEDPVAILEEIRQGVPKAWAGQLLIEVDRRKALKVALQTAQEGDVILVAGKGHEDYQIIGSQRLMFSDRQVIGELLE